MGTARSNFAGHVAIQVLIRIHIGPICPSSYVHPNETAVRSSCVHLSNMALLSSIWIAKKWIAVSTVLEENQC